MPVDKEVLVKAVEEAKKGSKKRNFKQSVELVLNLQDIDLKKPENRINEIIELPNLIGKPVKICVFATGDLALRAKKANADMVLDREALETFSKEKKKSKKLANGYDFFIAEAPLMPLIGKTLGPFLGPRGKMPTPVPPTAPIETIIEKNRRSVHVRLKDQLNTQCRLGTEEMPSDKIAENIQAVITRLERKLEKGLKNIRSAYVKTTMGQLTRIEL